MAKPRTVSYLAGHEGGHTRKVLRAGLSCSLMTHPLHIHLSKTPSPAGPPASSCAQPTECPAGSVTTELTTGTWASEASGHLVQDVGRGCAFPTLLPLCPWIQVRMEALGTEDMVDAPPSEPSNGGDMCPPGHMGCLCCSCHSPHGDRPGVSLPQPFSRERLCMNKLDTAGRMNTAGRSEEARPSQVRDKPESEAGCGARVGEYGGLPALPPESHRFSAEHEEGEASAPH